MELQLQLKMVLVRQASARKFAFHGGTSGGGGDSVPVGAEVVDSTSG